MNTGPKTEIEIDPPLPPEIAPYITIYDLIETACMLEPHLSAIGWHVGITGSCLIEGRSTKDGDLIVYPAKTSRIDFFALHALFPTLGFTGPTWRTPDHPGDDKQIWAYVYNNQRYDIFILR